MHRRKYLGIIGLAMRPCSVGKSWDPSLNCINLPTAIGDERHCVFDCPRFQGLRRQHAEIFRDSHDAMRSVMWQKDQKSVCALVLAIVNEAQTL